MPAKHIHKLKKHKYKNGSAIFFCTLPDCNFKIEAPLALGKECLCNICGNPFLLNEYTIRLTRPHCNNCGRREVKTPDGKKFYVNKNSSAAVLEQVAANDVESLKNRLSSLVKDEDI